MSSISSILARVLAHRHLPPRGAARLAALLPIVIVAGLIGLKARAGANAPAALAPGDTVVVYGPLRFGSAGDDLSHGGGVGMVGFEEIVLNVVPGKRYTLRVRNGAPDGSARASGGRVAFNNAEVVSGGDFSSAQTEWNRVVEARGVDTLFLNAAGPSGSYFTVELLETADASFPIYGVERFTRGVGPVTQTRTFNVPASAAAPYRLCLSNGNENGTRRVSDVTIRLNGTTVVSQAQGFGGGVASLMRDVSLVQGTNRLDVTLPRRQPAGFLDLCVTATDVTPPALSIGSPVPGLVTNDTVITVSGTVQDQTATSVTVNGVTAQRTGNNYTAQVLLTTDGNKVVTVTAVDGALLRTDSTRTVVRDRQAPILTVSAPADGLVTGQHAATLSGSVSDRTAVTVSANGVPVPVDSAGGFVGSVPLAEGANLVTVAASDAAGNQVVLVRSVRRTAGMPDIAMSGPGGGFTCLDQGGPLVTLSGAQTQQYFHVTLADSTKIDARTAYWNNINYPSRIGGGVNLCWSGGEAHDSFPPSTTWSTARSRYAHFVETTSATDVEDMRIFNYGYGISEATSVPNWSIRRALVKYSRATCVTNDFYHSGTIDASFLDGCWRGVGSDEQSTLGDSSANLVVIRNSLIRLQAIDGSYFPNVPNQSAFWEWNVHAPRMSLINNVFRADAHSREGQGNRMYMAPPPGKLAECSGNIMVWLGKGPFPETLPACFTLTTNVAVWDSAVAAWNATYPPVVADVATPIVSMFQPGVVGDTILTGTVTLIATAVDDRSVAGVQLQIDGQDIGQEQTSPTPYIGADSLLNRDFTTKYQIAWNSASVANGTHTLRARARDAAGHSKTSAAVSVTVSNGGLPPDPATVATPIDPTVATNLGSSTAFLYTGANPIQTGVAPGTIGPVRAAVVRGKVLTTGGQALSGVQVTIHGHAELGQTLSRADGMFDLAVNGGEPLVVEYAKSGFLKVQRTVAVPWQDFVLVDDVVMTGLDPQVTTIDFSAPVQVARGSVVTDTDGPRRATLFFKQGTTAEMVLPDGSTSPLTQLHVRATEYTVGPNGPKAMPAPLPPTSGYTYAAEVSVDEALAAGATTVRFTHPVTYYLENFLKMRPGQKVPLAVYDRSATAWMPLDNGRVIAIVGEQSGQAQVDTNGDGTAETPAALDAIGIDAGERTQLATLYDPPQTLWRFALDHFSPLDGNSPRVSPNAQPPNEPTPGSEGGSGGKDGKNSTDDPSQCPGSIIECENQILGERLGLVGTGLTLNYRSNRVPGRTSAYATQVTLTGDTLPPGLRSVVLEVNVAGRQFIDSFVPAPNLKDTVTWDGRDAYGRVVQGIQPAVVRIHYVYDRTYYSIPAVQARSFGLTCSGDQTGGMLACILPGMNVDSLPARGRDALTQEFRVLLGSMSAYAGLGGWTLSGHHAYDPVLRTLYLGSGERQTAQVVAGVQTLARAGVDWPKVGTTAGASGVAVGEDRTVYVADQGNHVVRRIRPDGVIDVFAGNGQSGASGDGGPALSAGMNPLDLEAGPNGSLYIADRNNNRIRRIGANDTITTVAGNGGCTTGALAPDGSVATAVELCTPEHIAVGPDGTLYIAYWDVVWRVGPDGLVYRVAGLGLRDDKPCYYQDFGFNEICRDEIVATRARIGFIGSLALGPDGSLYIGDVWADVIRRVTPDGIIHRFAGTGVNGSTGDGGPAVNATFKEPSDIFVGPDGTVYVVDDWYRIRKISTGGTIITIAGTGQLCSTSSNPTCSEGAPALQADLSAPFAVALGPDGTLYYTENFGDRVRRLLPPMPGFKDAEYVVAAADGSALYGFDRLGRHLRTLDTRTGAIVASFAYDSAGRLVTLADADSNIVTIERNGSGNPTAIVAPFGQRTALALNGDGYLSSATDPAQQATTLTYHPGGLLATLTDPRTGVHTYTYDGSGRLTRDDDPAGGFTTLTPTPGAFTVTRTRALGRRSTYQVQRLGDGTERRVRTGPAGTVTDVSIKPDASATNVGPDSVVTQWTLGSDPRFGMQAPILRSLSLRLPSGLTSSAAAVRHASLSNPADPLSLVSQVDSVSLNGNWTVSTYTAATRRLVKTSAEGRQLFGTFDAKGRALAAQLAGLDSVRFAYDARGRLQEQQTGGRRWTYSYDARGRLLSTLDPLGRRDSLFYDNADRLTRRVLPDGRAVLFGYDGNDNLTSVTPPGRPAHGFQYTPVDLARQYDPPGIPGPKPTRYFYNLERQVDSIVRPDSIAIKFGYDTAGRASSVTFDRGTVTFGYAPTSGNLVAMRAPTGDSVKFTYDGLLPTQVRWVGAVPGSAEVSYNTDLRVATQTVNGANAVSFGYDHDGLLTSAGALHLGRSTTNGLLLADTLGPVLSSYQYTTRGELKGYRVTRAAATPFGVGYTRDTLGRIVQLFDTTQGTPSRWSFVYDSVGRLAADSVNGAIFHAFTYDPNGNRLTYTSANGTVNYTYDNQDRLLSAGTTSYTYGSNGELKTKTVPGVGTTTYTYDALGNLITVVLPNSTRIDYVIDAQNRRVGRKVNGVLVQGWLYQNQLNPVAELDGSGAVVSRFVYGTRANVPDYIVKNGTAYRIIADHLGSVRLVVDTATGTVVQRVDYDEWGNVNQNTNPGFQPFGFGGGLYDGQTGLVRFGARDYDAPIGRWTAKDPIGFVGGHSNLMSYAANDPINAVDPSGLRTLGLSDCLKDFLSGFRQQLFPDVDFDKVTIHVGEPFPWYVRWFATVDPIAFTSDYDLYFREGYFNPGSASGVAALMHELYHTQQYQENGPNTFRLMYLDESLGKLRYGFDPYWANIFEIDAYGVQAILERYLKQAYGTRGPCPDSCDGTR